MTSLQEETCDSVWQAPLICWSDWLVGPQSHGYMISTRVIIYRNILYLNMTSSENDLPEQHTWVETKQIFTCAYLRTVANDLSFCRWENWVLCLCVCVCGPGFVSSLIINHVGKTQFKWIRILFLKLSIVSTINKKFALVCVLNILVK